jgi:hypothetical protein
MLLTVGYAMMNKLWRSAMETMVEPHQEEIRRTKKKNEERSERTGISADKGQTPALLFLFYLPPLFTPTYVSPTFPLFITLTYPPASIIYRT